MLTSFGGARLGFCNVTRAVLLFLLSLVLTLTLSVFLFCMSISVFVSFVFCLLSLLNLLSLASLVCMNILSFFCRGGYLGYSTMMDASDDRMAGSPSCPMGTDCTDCGLEVPYLSVFLRLVVLDPTLPYPTLPVTVGVWRSATSALV